VLNDFGRCTETEHYIRVKTYLTTQRLSIAPLSLAESAFILELLNSAGWLRFIGDRNVNSLEEAASYIHNIVANPDSRYFVCKLRDSKKPIGVVTLIKRNYLKFHDIGFAFLPHFINNGYGYEAANEMIKYLQHAHLYPQLLAISIPENTSSIKLLEKLGLRFEREMQRDHEKLLVYGISLDKLNIDEITRSFFALFTNTNNSLPDLDLLSQLCIPEAMIIQTKESIHTVYALNSFMEPRKVILTDGTLTEFEERETAEETTVVHNIAQRSSSYSKRGMLNGVPFQQEGHKSFQFIKTNEGWRISSVIWEDEDAPQEGNTNPVL